MNNLFTPNFGQIPNFIAGRTSIIHELREALINPIGNPAITTLLIGARGTGKTALMTYIANEAVSKGWISVNVHCDDGMLEDVIQQILIKAKDILPRGFNVDGASLSLSAGVVGARLDLKQEDSISLNWRSRMTAIFEVLEKKKIGIYITVDEINIKVKEVIDLSKVYQLFIRENRKVGLLMSGLPHNVSQLLNNESVSFLRRANQRYIRKIDDYEIENAFEKTVVESGKTIKSEGLTLAVKSIGGFPYMMQLVGYRAWEESGKRKEITIEDVKKGISMAQNDLRTRVLKITLDEISDVGITFLQAMTKDENYSTVSDIASRLGKSSSYISNYKKILCEYGVIEDTGRGKLVFSLPGIREYIDEYAETY